MKQFKGKMGSDKKFFAFGNRLRFVREKLSLTQSELASKLGFGDYKAIGRFERGERLPNVEALIHLVKLGNFNLHWLITGEPSPDGETWRGNYGELFRMYSSDGGLWIDRLRGQIADLTQKKLVAQEKQSRGEKVSLLYLERIDEEIRYRQDELDRILDHLKRAVDRFGGIQIDY